MYSIFIILYKQLISIIYNSNYKIIIIIFLWIINNNYFQKFLDIRILRYQIKIIILIIIKEFIIKELFLCIKINNKKINK